MPNANEDHAIVAGLSHYPDKGLGKLKGPENDARAFYEWVTKKAGVKKANATLVLSSQFKPPAKRPIGAKPDETEIDNAFRELHAKSVENTDKRKGPRVGRRLYVYLAGHGFVPQWSERILALLTANAAEGSPTHVAAPLYQRWARDSGAFEEVLLFMDCCGSTGREMQLRPQPFELVKDPDAAASGRLFFAAACKPGFKTREKALSVKGKSRGVFTLCLLDGLQARAAENGSITSHSLGKYLELQLRKLLDKDDLTDDEISKDPYVDFEPRGTPFVLFDNISEQASLQPVTLRFQKSDVGKKFVLSLGLQPLLELKVSSTAMQQKLRTGIYSIRGQGRERSFELPLPKGETGVRV